MTSANKRVPVIDYEGSNYRTDFWVASGREYEDAAERIALQRLIPQRGGRIAEIGAGFGRLADLYLGYRQIVLFDYSRTLLEEAVAQRGHDPRFVFVAGNLYQLPLASGVLDTLVMVRVMHHLADVPLALTQLRRVLHRDSVAVIEYANKRHLKALLRWALRQQTWSPWAEEPVEFVELNFDFHPAWMDARFAEAGFATEERFAVSHFRLPLLKRWASPQRLAALDSRLFGWGGRMPLAPSVFMRLRAPRAASAPQGDAVLDVAQLFCCPACRAQRWERPEENMLQCGQCNARYVRKNKIWDFKEVC
jgi:SAM-dependent methyltransferase